MDRSVVLLGASALLLVAGCAHTSESVAVHDRVVVAVDNPPPPADLPPNAFSNEEPTMARPRLSRTITLGQGSSEGVYGTPAAPPPSAAAGSNTNVTVNNHVTVMQPPVYYYGGYGAYGYGYGSGYGRGAGSNGPNSGGTMGSDGRGGVAPAPGPWAPSGWEGAGRTAAPGATPGVGGNFAPAPSFGPRQMK